MPELVIKDLNKRLIVRGNDSLLFIILEEELPQTLIPERIVFPLSREHQQKLFEVLVKSLAGGF